jgi:hypothetical protein
MTTATQTTPRTPASIRLVLLVVAALAGASLVGLGALTLLDLASRHTFVTRSGYAGVRALYIDEGSGDISLTGAPAGSDVTVVANVTEGLATPSRHASLDPGGALHLTTHCPGLLGLECQVDYHVTVPPGITVHANSGAGSVVASDITTSSQLRLESGAGDVTATGVSAPMITLDSGAGDVRAQLRTAAQHLEATSGAGDVTLTVPDERYAVQASSGAGTVSDSSIRIDPSSPRTIHASSGAGDVRISVNR